jgi:hypothetical protein
MLRPREGMVLGRSVALSLRQRIRTVWFDVDRQRIEKLTARRGRALANADGELNQQFPCPAGVE